MCLCLFSQGYENKHNKLSGYNQKFQNRPFSREKSKAFLHYFIQLAKNPTNFTQNGITPPRGAFHGSWIKSSNYDYFFTQFKNTSMYNFLFSSNET